MNFISKKFGRRLICTSFLSIVLLFTFTAAVTTSKAEGRYPEPIIVEAEKITSEDIIINNEVSPVTESVSEENIVAEVVELQQTFSAPTETILSEVVISDEERWTSISNSCEPYTMFVNVSVDSSLNVRSQAVIGDNIVGGLHYGDQVTVVGYNTYDQSWSAIEYRDKIAFVSNEYLEEWVDLSLRKDETYQNPEWDGETKLNSRNGRIEGPSGQETYYNLPMGTCVYYMNLLGYDYEVWVREDGVKMFGDYIMVAANLETRPKGSLVETSLGTGIIVDTGEFVNWNPNGIDIAVTW